MREAMHNEGDSYYVIETTIARTIVLSVNPTREEVQDFLE